MPIIAVILMLFSKAAKLNSLAFLVGWVLGPAVVGAVVLASGISSENGAPSTASGWIEVLIGALILARGVMQWSNRPGAGEEPSVPAWMSKIDDFTATTAFGAGVLPAGAMPRQSWAMASRATDTARTRGASAAWRTSMP